MTSKAVASFGRASPCIGVTKCLIQEKDNTVPVSLGQIQTLEQRVRIVDGVKPMCGRHMKNVMDELVGRCTNDALENYLMINPGDVLINLEDLEALAVRGKQPILEGIDIADFAKVVREKEEEVKKCRQLSTLCQQQKESICHLCFWLEEFHIPSTAATTLVARGRRRFSDLTLWCSHKIWGVTCSTSNSSNSHSAI